MSKFFKKIKEETNNYVPDEATLNREKQKGFFDELMRIAGQKQKLRQKGFDFTKTFDENYDEGFRLYENPKNESSDKKMQTLSFETADTDEPKSNSGDYLNTESNNELPIFEKRDVYTEDEMDVVRERTGDGDYPDWYIKSLKPIYEEIDAAEEAGDTEREAAAKNGLDELNSKYSQYENYPEWAKYFMDEYTTDFINADAAQHGYGYASVLFGSDDADYDQRKDNAHLGGETVRRQLAFRDKLYTLDKKLGETYDALMNEKVNAIKIYKRAIEYGNYQVASNAKKIIGNINSALNEFDEYYETIKNSTDKDSWIGYYDSKTNDEIFFSKIGSILAQTDEEKDVYQSSLDFAKRAREDYEEKLSLREEIARNVPALIAEFDECSNEYLEAEKDYYDAIETGDTAKADEALKRMDEAHSKMNAVKTKYENELEKARQREAAAAIPLKETTDYSLTNTNAYIPAVPKYTNTQNNRSADSYRTVIEQFDVVNNPRYARRNGYTYCNIYVWDVISAMGVTIPYWVNRNNGSVYRYDSSLGYAENAKTAYQLDANGMCKWLESTGPTFGWTNCSASKAQKMANDGHPVIAAWYNEKGIGHVAVVVPKDSDDMTDNVVISQAGAHNYNYAPVSVGFGNRKVKYYYHE